MTTKKQSRAGNAPAPAVPSLLAGINERVFLDIVDEQREQLLNVTAALLCMEIAVQSDSPPDPGVLRGAVGLAREELQRVTEALAEEELLQAASEASEKVEEVRAASDASREEQAQAAPGVMQ
jgi:hypothetical protein